MAEIRAHFDSTDLYQKISSQNTCCIKANVPSKPANFNNTITCYVKCKNPSSCPALPPFLFLRSLLMQPEARPKCMLNMVVSTHSHLLGLYLCLRYKLGINVWFCEGIHSASTKHQQGSNHVIVTDRHVKHINRGELMYIKGLYFNWFLAFNLDKKDESSYTIQKFVLVILLGANSMDFTLFYY